jgi:hypothetical protein
VLSVQTPPVFVSGSPGDLVNGTSALKTFFKLHLLKQKIGHKPPQTRILGIQVAYREPIAFTRIRPNSRPSRRIGRTVCPAPTMVRHDGHAQRFGYITLAPPLGDHFLRLIEQGGDFRCRMTLAHCYTSLPRTTKTIIERTSKAYQVSDVSLA